MNSDKTINYLEVPSKDIPKTKAFFTDVFKWSFTDYGDEYVAFSSPGMEGGFYLSDNASLTSNGATLIVFYAENLQQTQSEIEQAGGNIIKPIFDFPGGRRFHFTDPGGSEFAVWSDK